MKDQNAHVPIDFPAIGLTCACLFALCWVEHFNMGFFFWVNQIPLLFPGLKPEFWFGSKLGIDLLDGMGLSTAMPPT